MNNLEIKECFEVIEDLNYQLEKLNFPEWIRFEIISNGYVHLISLNEIEMYNSENSDRWYKDMNGKESQHTIKQLVLINFETFKEKLLKINLI